MTKILVAEDSATQIVHIRGLLQGAGLDVEVVTNGREAVQKLEAGNAYDLVLTDMMMPEMDGLQLVRAVRVHYSGLPVILMTGQGTDSLAVEALEEGAAGYVPKSQLNDRLTREIRQVLHSAKVVESYATLLDCLKKNEFYFELTNDISLIDPLTDLLQQMMGGMRLCDSTGRIRCGLALEHALLNAMFRGNLEISPEQLSDSRSILVDGEVPSEVREKSSQSPYCDRKVTLEVVLTQEQATFEVRDEGSGFDTSQVPTPADPDVLEREGGHGLLLMQTFMDEVKFNEAGNQVIMVKRRDG